MIGRLWLPENGQFGALDQSPLMKTVEWRRFKILCFTGYPFQITLIP